MTTQEPPVTPALAAEHGLKPDEFDKLVAALGRMPTYTELGMVSVMWSEHCSYKSSRIHLKKLPTEGARVIQGPGENAGAVDIGDGQAAVFKMESHNHPSFIEPYQGAATGVGGICRDVFTMGARPIALANCLRFGRPDHPKTPYLVSGVVAGISGYGNSFGVPNVTGDVHFDRNYDGNILVNAFCLGLARADKIFLGTASGVGNPVLYVGAKTGRDGIHGATMASAEFGEDAEQSRPAVQVGDPFMEKLLLEACLELMESDAIVGIQDMGAAGLTSSSVEMAARAGSGIELELERVPQREANMTAYEMLLSESQERMLMVVERGKEVEALAIFEKWDLDAAVIGRVTDTGRVVMKLGGVVEADLPAELLAEGLVYDRPVVRPAYLEEAQAEDPAPSLTDAGAALLELLGAPNVTSKAWVYRQYDHNVRHGTVLRPGQGDAGVVRVLAPGGREKGLGVSVGCQSRLVYLDPYEGAKLAVAEAYANLAAVGAEPLAITDCLNFGSPENPEIMWQLAEAIRGLGDACRELGTPVVSGNVSLYNETDGVAIKPTPMVAMVGLLDDVRHHAGSAFPEAGLEVAVVGELAGSLAGSEYQERRLGRPSGVIARFDAARDKPVMDGVRQLIAEGLVTVAHDVSEGGLAVCVAECAMGGEQPVGVALDLPEAGPTDAHLLFGEAPARFVIAYPKGRRDQVAAKCERLGARLTPVGETGGDRVRVIVGGDERRGFDVPVADALGAWRGGLSAITG
jgi:phosphoribosylformylglycinamidine synthase subunit PurL